MKRFRPFTCLPLREVKLVPVTTPLRELRDNIAFALLLWLIFLNVLLGWLLL